MEATKIETGHWYTHLVFGTGGQPGRTGQVYVHRTLTISNDGHQRVCWEVESEGDPARKLALMPENFVSKIE